MQYVALLFELVELKAFAEGLKLLCYVKANRSLIDVSWLDRLHTISWDISNSPDIII